MTIEGINITEGNSPAYYYPQHEKSRLWLGIDRKTTDDPEKVYLFLAQGDALNWATFNGWRLSETSCIEIKMPWILEYNENVYWQPYRYFRTLDDAKQAWILIKAIIKRSPLRLIDWRLKFIPSGAIEMEYRPDDDDSEK